MSLMLRAFLVCAVTVGTALCFSAASMAGSLGATPRGYFEITVKKGIAPTMPAALRRSMERDWRLFQGERQLSNIAKSCNPRPAYSLLRFKNPYGVVLWTYYQQVYFCFNGRMVTYFRRVRWGEVASLTPYVEWKPWEFKGHIGSNCGNDYCSGGGRTRSRLAWTQGRFEVCLIPVLGGLCTNQSPIVGITVYGNGSVRPFSRGG